MSNKTPSKGQWTIFWWVGWIFLTIASFFVACYFWTPFIAKHFGSINKPGVSVIWIGAVFGTWMVLLIPLIIGMYNKVDRAYDEARIKREAAALKKERSDIKVRSQLIPYEERVLSKDLRKKIKSFSQAVNRGHLVTATLRDGRKVENVFVADKREVLGVYGLERLSFEVKDIVDIAPANLEKLPDLTAEYWLRLDGVGGDE